MCNGCPVGPKGHSGLKKTAKVCVCMCGGKPEWIQTRIDGYNKSQKYRDQLAWAICGTCGGEYCCGHYDPPGPPGVCGLPGDLEIPEGSPIITIDCNKCGTYFMAVVGIWGDCPKCKAWYGWDGPNEPPEYGFFQCGT